MEIQKPVFCLHIFIFSVLWLTRSSPLTNHFPLHTMFLLAISLFVFFKHYVLFHCPIPYQVTFKHHCLYTELCLLLITSEQKKNEHHRWRVYSSFSCRRCLNQCYRGCSVELFVSWLKIIPPSFLLNMTICWFRCSCSTWPSLSMVSVVCGIHIIAFLWWPFSMREKWWGAVNKTLSYFSARDCLLIDIVSFVVVS